MEYFPVWPTYSWLHTTQVATQIHSLHMAGFVTVGKFYFLSGSAKQLRPTMDLLCFPWQPQSAQCLQGLDKPSVCPCVLFKARCFQLVGVCPIVVGLFELVFSFLSFFDRVSRWGKDVYSPNVWVTFLFISLGTVFPFRFHCYHVVCMSKRKFEKSI